MLPPPPTKPQVDEPALREGLPLKAGRHAEYLAWAVDAFKLATTVAAPDVQARRRCCDVSADGGLPG